MSVLPVCALLSTSCPGSPEFQPGDVDEATDTSTPLDTSSDVELGGDGELEDLGGEPCGGVCLAGELCVEGACQSCAPACAVLAAARQCGTDGCGGTCGCPSAGPCASGRCECVSADCVDVIVTSGAASPTLAIGLRDAPLIGYLAGDGGTVARTFAFAYWDGARFERDVADALAPIGGTSAIVEGSDGRVHILHQGTVTSPARPRHLVRLRDGWSARTLGSEPCVEPKLVHGNGLFAGCFHPESAALSVWRWDDSGSSWTPLTTAPALQVAPSIESLPDERDWAVGADGRIHLAYARRLDRDAAPTVKYLDYMPERGWSAAAEVAQLESLDERQGVRLRVVVDVAHEAHIFVRDHSPDDFTAASSLGRFWPVGSAWEGEYLWKGARAGAAHFAVGARRRGGFDVVFDEGDPEAPFVIHRVRLADDDVWIEGGAWPLGQETLDGIALAYDANDEPRVVMTTDETLLRYWSPLGPGAWR